MHEVLDKKWDTWQERSLKHNHMYMKASLLSFKNQKCLATDSWENVQSGLCLPQVVLTLEAEKFMWNLILRRLHVQNMPSNITGQSGSGREHLHGTVRAVPVSWGCSAPFFVGSYAEFSAMLFPSEHNSEVLGLLSLRHFSVHVLHWTASAAQSSCCRRALKCISDCCRSSPCPREDEATARHISVSWTPVDIHVRTWAGRRMLSSLPDKETEKWGFCAVTAQEGLEKILDLKSVFKAINLSSPVRWCTRLGHQFEQNF